MLFSAHVADRLLPRMAPEHVPAFGAMRRRVFVAAELAIVDSPTVRAIRLAAGVAPVRVPAVHARNPVAKLARRRDRAVGTGVLMADVAPRHEVATRTERLLAEIACRHVIASRPPRHAAFPEAALVAGPREKLVRRISPTFAVRLDKLRERSTRVATALATFGSAALVTVGSGFADAIKQDLSVTFVAFLIAPAVTR